VNKGQVRFADVAYVEAKVIDIFGNDTMALIAVSVG